MKSFFPSLKADPLSGKRIAPEATLAQMRLITASNSTVRSDFGVRSHNERLRNAFDREPQVERKTVSMNQLLTRRF